MAAQVLEIIDIPDWGEEDNDIYVVYIRVPVKKGTGKSDAIDVENYALTAKKAIDHRSEDSFLYGGEVELLHSSPFSGKRVYKGESSNSKVAKSIEFNIPVNFMCEICADDKPGDDLFRKLGCSHSYCSDCIGKYIASKLQENITTITCPVSGCFGSLEPHHCRSILPKNVFERWGDALCEAVILGSEKFYCPYKNCSAMLVDDTSCENEVIMESECPYCNRLFCAHCKVPWHSGISCSEFQKLNKDERSNEDIMLMNLAKTNKWRRCSNSKCRIYVERSEGCLFMRCRCGHTFCYNCGTSIKDHYCPKCKR